MVKKRVLLLITFCLVVALSCSEGLIDSKITPKQIGLSPNYIMHIGSIPDDLTSYFGPTAEAGHLEQVTDYAQEMVNLPSALVINSDDISDQNQLLSSSLIQMIQEKGIPLVVGYNKDESKRKQLTERLGGSVFEGSKLTMITQKTDTLSIIPVGNQTGDSHAYLSIDELAMMIQPAEPDSTLENLNEITSIGTEPSANRTTMECTFQDDKNQVPPYSIYCTLSMRKGWKDNLITKMGDYLNFHQKKQRVTGSYTIEGQRVLTNILPGQGQITFRETTLTVNDKSYNNSWDIKISASVSFWEVVKVSAWYSRTESKTTAYSSGYSVGQTIYSNTCTYACCETIANYALRQNTILRSGVLIGNVTYNCLPWTGPQVGHHQHTFCYSKKGSPIQINFKSKGSPYTELMFYRKNIKCNRYSCRAYKSCNKDGAPK